MHSRVKYQSHGQTRTASTSPHYRSEECGSAYEVRASLAQQPDILSANQADKAPPDYTPHHQTRINVVSGGGGLCDRWDGGKEQKGEEGRREQMRRCRRGKEEKERRYWKRLRSSNFSPSTHERQELKNTGNIISDMEHSPLNLFGARACGWA